MPSSSFFSTTWEKKVGLATLQASDYSITLTLPPGYRILTPTNWIEGEIKKGGGGQYFWNRLQDYQLMTNDAIDAYEIIKARDQASALRDCVRVFLPLEEECRWLKETKTTYEGFEIWMAKWNSLEYRGDNPLCNNDDIWKRFRVPWIRGNIDAFLFETPNEV